MRALLTISLAILLGTIAAAQEPVVADKPAADPPVAKQSSGDEKEKPMSFWMEKKLEYSQAMLRGLVTGDLENVALRAQQMRFVSKVEGWIRKSQPGYKAQLQAFDFATAEMERQARAGNLEGTTLAFQQLTTSCVSCHAMIRNRN